MIRETDIIRLYEEAPALALAVNPIHQGPEMLFCCYLNLSANRLTSAQDSDMLWSSGLTR